MLGCCLHRSGRRKFQNLSVIFHNRGVRRDFERGKFIAFDVRGFGGGMPALCKSGFAGGSQLFIRYTRRALEAAAQFTKSFGTALKRSFGLKLFSASSKYRATALV